MCRIRPQAAPGWLGPRLGWVDWGWFLFLVGVGVGVPNVFGGWHFVVCQNHIIVFMDVVFLSELYEFGHWFWYPKSLDTSSFERLITYTENTVH